MSGRAGRPAICGLHAGDEVVVTEMEHHANLVPWQRACARSGAGLRWLPLTDDGRLDLSATRRRRRAPSPGARVGARLERRSAAVNPLPALVARAREVGALVVLDACQSLPHLPVDLAALGVDAAVFSGAQDAGADRDRRARGPAASSCRRCRR